MAENVELARESGHSVSPFFFSHYKYTGVYRSKRNLHFLFNSACGVKVMRVCACWMAKKRDCVYVGAHTSVKHSCCRVGLWWDRCDWLSLPLPHPIMLICSGTNRRTPLGVLQAHSQSLVLQKIVLQSYLNCEFSLLFLSLLSVFRHFFLLFYLTSLPLHTDTYF